MKTGKQAIREPLHITISVLFIVLLLGVGFVLSLYSYQKTTAIVISATNKLFDQFALEVAGNFKSTYRPVIQSVSLLSFSHAVKGTGMQERLDSIALLADVLRHEPALAGLQVGYENGDYFILRPLPSAYEQKLFAAPEEAVYVVDDIAGDGSGAGQLQRLFLNSRLQEIQRNAPVPTTYDPRTRPWFIQAMETPSVVSTPPYLFTFLRKVGTTISRQTPGGGAVVAADITLEQISRTLANTSFAPHEEKVVLGKNGRVIAYSHQEQIVPRAAGNSGMPTLAGLGSDVLGCVAEQVELQPGELRFSCLGRDWLGKVVDLDIGHDIAPRLLLTVPADEILVEARRIRKNAFLLTLLTLAVAVPVIWFVSRTISGSIRKLASETERVSRFDFADSATIRSRITEVDDLAGSMSNMQQTIARFLKLVQSIAGEQDFETTLKRITRETMTVSRADAVISYLVDEEQGLLVPDVIMDRGTGSLDASRLPAVKPEVFSGLTGDSDGVVRLDRREEGPLGAMPALLEVGECILVPMPLVDRQGDLIGMLALLYRDFGTRGELSGRLSFVRAFSGFAAVSLETRQLIRMQKQLLDSFIGLLAGAIDQKSPYTGGHCQRVPVITEMLARAACDCRDAPFENFELSVDEWEELHIAAWLHDCGKVTTPEYVVDKATKLETIYNRIHEIRTRFEILKRDAEITYWQQLAEGYDGDALKEELAAQWRQLDEEFAFVADCNLGGEFMAAEKMERLEAIGRRTWMRTLDDRLGLSWEEMKRRESVPAQELPVRELLLADKPEHCIRRPARERVAADNPWGFKLDVPEHLYCLGELHNLRVERGTLTAEERFKINDHIVQTIKMLSQLPFPRHLSRVTEIAGCHHETMTGTGYPRRLRGDQMSLTARMMVIADIFEALTASDRPYKKAKKLSEALQILCSMKKEQHIDPQLFELFLTSGVYLEYAQQYLERDQIDEVEISDYLG